MPPRPRPRPRPHPPSSPSGSNKGHEHPSVDSRLEEKRKDEEDEDAFFMRNKGRSLKEVNERAARAAARAAQSPSPGGSGDDEETGDDDTPKISKDRKHNMMKRANVLPKWTKKGGIINLLEDSESDREDDSSLAYEGTPSKRVRTGVAKATAGPMAKRGGRPQSRSRSRSLTPPPDLTLAQKMYAEEAIKNALRSENMLHTRADVIVIDDGDDVDDGGNADLDPALRHIAQSLERAARRNGAFSSTQEEPPGRLHRGSSGKPPDVTVRVKWVPHPNDEMAHARSQQIWSFVVNRHNSLKELLLQTSKRAHVLAENLVLMRDGKRVFTSVSPDGLGAWDRIDLDVCDRATFDALHARHFRSPSVSQTNEDESETHRELSAALSESSADNRDDDGKFKLVLRARDSKEVTLTVRPTTTCGKIVRAFLTILVKEGSWVPKNSQVASKIYLCVDGEKQNPDTLIVDCDLEDGDMVEVVGL